MSVSQITRCGVSVALLAVASSVSLSIGPVPFTLQTLALALLLTVLDGKEAVWSVAIYILLGSLGVPVFSGFSGGISHLVGPTGGFIWGFLVGTAAGALIRKLELPFLGGRVKQALAVLAMLLISYAAGAAQLVALMNMSLAQALAVGVIPFVIPDLVKLAVGVEVGNAVKRALGRSSAGILA